MKKEFSKKWIGSKQPRKQRKFRARAPLHVLRKFLSANLSKDLRKKYSRRSFPLRKGDVVRIMRGSFKKQKGKIEIVDIKRTRVVIEKIRRSKKDGTKVAVYFSPSKLQIQELNLDDKARMKSIGRKMKGEIEKKNLGSSSEKK